MIDKNEKEPTAAKPLVHNEIVPQPESLANDYDIDAYLGKRTEFITKVNKIMVEGKDFHLIQGKKSMAKGGAEKIAAIFGWQAMFLPDDDTIKMLGTDKGVIAYICKLQKGSHFIGEGRGARSLVQDKGDVNKAIKMASKSAFVDAVLRSSGLSDFYTQDIEDMNGHQTQESALSEAKPIKDVSDANKGKSITDKQSKMIHALMKQKGITTLGQAGIEKIEHPTMQDASMIIKKLMDFKSEDLIIQIDNPYIPNREGD